MAKVSSKPPRIRPIRDTADAESSTDGTQTAVLEGSPPEAPAAEPETPFDPAPQPPKRKTPKSITFFDRVGDIDLADWGTRAKIKVYRLAPLINRLVGSENKYVTIYREPITEEKLKVDHGSGRYRLYLNFKGAGEKGEKELDMVELDILDPAYPPKVPAGEWIHDDRNKEWAWARPAGATPPTNGTAATPAPAASADPINAFDTFLNIQDRIEERMKPTPPPQPIAPPPPPDPFDTAKKIMEMRQNDPMVAMLLGRMEAMDKSAEAARQREYELQKELRQIQTAPPPASAQPKTLLEQLTELGALKDTLGKVLGMGSEAAATVASRPSRFAWLADVGEVVERAAPILSPIAEGLGHYLSTARNPVPVVNGNGTPQPIQPPAADPMRAFVQQVITPAMMSHFESGDTGSDFAAWLYNGFPRQFDQFQKFKHPMLPGKEGAEAIIAAYKATGIWTQLAAREAEFRTFVSEFCAWAKPEEEEAQTVEGVTVEPSGVTDFDEEEQPQ